MSFSFYSNNVPDDDPLNKSKASLLALPPLTCGFRRSNMAALAKRWRKRPDKHIPLSRSTIQKWEKRILLTSYWPEFSHMVITICKVCLEM